MRAGGCDEFYTAVHRKPSYLRAPPCNYKTGMDRKKMKKDLKYEMQYVRF
jgi:hypothetical protein